MGGRIEDGGAKIEGRKHADREAGGNVEIERPSLLASLL
jgi:hypothetical protein